MKTDTDWQAAYLHRVDKLLTCPRTERARLRKKLDWIVTQFREENPDADAAAWEHTLGTPEELAEELLSSCDPAAVKREQKNRRRILLLSAVILVAITVCALLYAAHVIRTQGGYTEIETRIYITEDPPEDFMETHITYQYEEESEP